MSDVPQTVVETAGFLRDADAFFDEDERAELVGYIAANPDSGDIMPETGGVRKMRWGIEGRGKRGGVRVVYYFHSKTTPVFLLNVFAKNEKANLSKAERNAMKRITAEIAKSYPKRGHEVKKKTAGQRIIESLNEALSYAKGDDVPGIRVTKVEVPAIDVRKVRTRLKLSQTQFALKFGFSPALVRNWEQGRNRPDGAARVLLAVIDQHPEAVEDALGNLRRAS